MLSQRLQAKANALRATLDKAPQRLANAALDYSYRAFRAQAWDGKAWKPRKKTKGNEGRAILIQSGRLRRSLRIISTATAPGIIRITLGSDVPYAQIHNNGGTINHPGGTPYITIGSKAGGFPKQRVFISNQNAKKFKKVTPKRTKPHNITIPQRQFLGNSRALQAELYNLFQSMVRKAVEA